MKLLVVLSALFLAWPSNSWAAITIYLSNSGPNVLIEANGSFDSAGLGAPSAPRFNAGTLFSDRNTSAALETEASIGVQWLGINAVRTGTVTSNDFYGLPALSISGDAFGVLVDGDNALFLHGADVVGSAYSFSHSATIANTSLSALSIPDNLDFTWTITAAANGAGDSLQFITAVPEPSGVVLTVIALCSLLCRRQRS